MLQPTVRRTWAPKGQTPIHYSWDRRDRLSVIAAISMSPRKHRLGLYFDMQSANIRADDFEDFVAELLLHFPKGVILVIDRWMVHRSGVRRLQERFGKRVDAQWLPAYAPELNPVEQIWNYSKYSQLANFIPDEIEHLAETLDVSLSHQAKQQNLLRSFFHFAKLKI
jgi:transposase